MEFTTISYNIFHSMHSQQKTVDEEITNALDNIFCSIFHFIKFSMTCYAICDARKNDDECFVLGRKLEETMNFI